MGVDVVQHGQLQRASFRMLSAILSAFLVILGIAILYRKVDWRDIASIWLKFDPIFLGLAILAYWMQYPINSFRFHRVTTWVSNQPGDRVPSFGFIFRLTCSGGFVAAAAPIGLAADVAKIIALRVFGNLSTTEAARCTLFDRVIGAQWIAILGLLTLPVQAWGGVSSEVIIAQILLFGGVILAVIGLLALPSILTIIRTAFVAKLMGLFADYRHLLLPKRSLTQMLIAIANLASAWAALFLLLKGAGLSTNPWLLAGVVPLLQLINSLPFLYMGWGGRELAMAATLGAAGGGLTVNEALAVSAAWGLTLIIAGMISGVFLIGDWQQYQLPPSSESPSPNITQ